MTHSEPYADLLDAVEGEAVVVAAGGLLDDEVDELEAEPAHAGQGEDHVGAVRVVGVVAGVVQRAEHHLGVARRLAAPQDGQARRAGDWRPT